MMLKRFLDFYLKASFGLVLFDLAICAISIAVFNWFEIQEAAECALGFFILAFGNALLALKN